MRLISDDSWSISDLIAPRSEAWRVSLPPWTVSSRIRWRMEAVSLSAPSPDRIREIPSWALLEAWCRPAVWARSFSLMVRPAASSAALLMRMPLDSFATLLEYARPVVDRLRWALRASRFGLISMYMIEG